MKFWFFGRSVVAFFYLDTDSFRRNSASRFGIDMPIVANFGGKDVVFARWEAGLVARRFGFEQPDNLPGFKICLVFQLIELGWGEFDLLSILLARRTVF